MRTIVLVLFLAACGGRSSPAPEDDTPEPTMMTPEECEAAGGAVKGDIGDGSVKCDAGFESIGNVSGGVEASLCCREQPDQGE